MPRDTLTIEGHDKGRKPKKAKRKPETHRASNRIWNSGRIMKRLRKLLSLFLVNSAGDTAAASNSIIETIPMKGATIVADEKRARPWNSIF